MRDPLALLARLEREIQETPVDDDSGRLAELLRERGLLIEELCAQPASREDLLTHFALGQELAERLRRERARLVEAWSACAHERQLLLHFQSQPNGRSRLLELG